MTRSAVSSAALLVMVAAFAIGNADARPRKRKPTPEQLVQAAQAARQSCEAECTKARAACTTEAPQCDTEARQCSEACFSTYLAALPPDARAAEEKRIEDERLAAEQAAAAEAARIAEQKARAEAASRADELAKQAEQAAATADQNAAAECAAFRESGVPAPPCSSAEAAQAAASARAAATEAAAAPDSQAALAAVERAEAALHQAEQARDRSAAARQRAEADGAAAQQRRTDELAAREVAWNRWISERDRLVGGVAAHNEKKQRRPLALTAIGVGGAATVAAVLFYRAEQGRYDAIENGELDTLEELKSARDDAHLYNKVWIGCGAVGAVGLAIGVPLLIRSLGGGHSPRISAVAAPHFGGLVWTGNLP